jgi:hypothetical protein
MNLELDEADKPSKYYFSKSITKILTNRPSSNIVWIFMFMMRLFVECSIIYDPLIISSWSNSLTKMILLIDVSTVTTRSLLLLIYLIILIVCSCMILLPKKVPRPIISSQGCWKLLSFIIEYSDYLLFSTSYSVVRLISCKSTTIKSEKNSDNIESSLTAFEQNIDFKYSGTQTTHSTLIDDSIDCYTINHFIIVFFIVSCFIILVAFQYLFIKIECLLPNENFYLRRYWSQAITTILYILSIIISTVTTLTATNPQVTLYIHGGCMMIIQLVSLLLYITRPVYHCRMASFMLVSKTILLLVVSASVFPLSSSVVHSDYVFSSLTWMGLMFSVSLKLIWHLLTPMMFRLSDLSGRYGSVSSDPKYSVLMLISYLRQALFTSRKQINSTRKLSIEDVYLAIHRLYILQNLPVQGAGAENSKQFIMEKVKGRGDQKRRSFRYGSNQNGQTPNSSQLEPVSGTLIIEYPTQEGLPIPQSSRKLVDKPAQAAPLKPIPARAPLTLKEHYDDPTPPKSLGGGNKGSKNLTPSGDEPLTSIIRRRLNSGHEQSSHNHVFKFPNEKTELSVNAIGQSGALSKIFTKRRKIHANDFKRLDEELIKFTTNIEERVVKNAGDNLGLLMNVDSFIRKQLADIVTSRASKSNTELCEWLSIFVYFCNEFTRKPLVAAYILKSLNNKLSKSGLTKSWQVQTLLRFCEDKLKDILRGSVNKSTTTYEKFKSEGYSVKQDYLYVIRFSQKFEALKKHTTNIISYLYNFSYEIAKHSLSFSKVFDQAAKFTKEDTQIMKYFEDLREASSNFTPVKILYANYINSVVQDRQRAAVIVKEVLKRKYLPDYNIGMVDAEAKGGEISIIGTSLEKANFHEVVLATYGVGKLMQYSVDELIGQPLETLIPEPIGKVHRIMIHPMNIKGDMINKTWLDMPVRRKNGYIRVVKFRALVTHKLISGLQVNAGLIYKRSQIDKNTIVVDNRGVIIELDEGSGQVFDKSVSLEVYCSELSDKMREIEPLIEYILLEGVPNLETVCANPKMILMYRIYFELREGVTQFIRSGMQGRIKANIRLHVTYISRIKTAMRTLMLAFHDKSTTGTPDFMGLTYNSKNIEDFLPGELEIFNYLEYLEHDLRADIQGVIKKPLEMVESVERKLANSNRSNNSNSLMANIIKVHRVDYSSNSLMYDDAIKEEGADESESHVANSDVRKHTTQSIKKNRNDDHGSDAADNAMLDIKYQAFMRVFVHRTENNKKGSTFIRFRSLPFLLTVYFIMMAFLSELIYLTHSNNVTNSQKISICIPLINMAAWSFYGCTEYVIMTSIWYNLLLGTVPSNYFQTLPNYPSERIILDETAKLIQDGITSGSYAVLFYSDSEILFKSKAMNLDTDNELMAYIQQPKGIRVHLLPQSTSSPTELSQPNAIRYITNQISVFFSDYFNTTSSPSLLLSSSEYMEYSRVRNNTLGDVLKDRNDMQEVFDRFSVDVALNSVRLSKFYLYGTIGALGCIVCISVGFVIYWIASMRRFYIKFFNLRVGFFLP